MANDENRKRKELGNTKVSVGHEEKTKGEGVSQIPFSCDHEVANTTRIKEKKEGKQKIPMNGPSVDDKHNI